MPKIKPPAHRRKADFRGTSLGHKHGDRRQLESLILEEKTRFSAQAVRTAHS